MSLTELTTLTASDKRAIALWGLAAVIGVIIVFNYHEAAFPSASIDFQVTRSEAEDVARDVLALQGIRPTGYQAVTTFGYNDQAKIYLERELGLEAANRLMASDVNIWRWDTRFFRPQVQEEYLVSISPDGRLVGFYREIEETRPGPTLSEREAREIGELFLRNMQSLDMAEYRLVESSTNALDVRTDHTFIWERRDFKAAEATARQMVTIQGNRVGGYSEFLKIPEAWQRDYTRIRARNEATQAVAQIGWVLVIIVILFLFIQAISRGLFLRSTWRFGIISGVLIGLTTLAMSVNLFPLSLASYATTDSLESFYLQLTLSAFIGAGFFLLFITLSGAAGSIPYRDILPDKIAPEWIFSRPVLRTREYFMASVIGYLIPPVMLGYITAFYVVGDQFGVWSPAAVDYTDMASTAMPWLFPLSIGLQASILEEFLFRLVAICFLKKFIKSNFIAILIPAVLWGFLHSNYPQQPFFIRGLELTVVGVMFGYVFLRFGIISTLIAHYAYDALLLSLFLFQSSRMYFQISGIIVVGLLLIPLIPSVIALLKRRLEHHPYMLNAAVTEQVAQPEAEEPEDIPATSADAQPPAASSPPVFLTARTTGLLIAAALISICVIALLPVERFLDFVEIRVSRTEATAVADEYLAGRGVDTEGFIKSAVYRTASSGASAGNKYIRQEAGLAALNEAYRTRLDPAFWRVRYFKSLEKEEYRIRISPDGQVIGYDHRMAEEAAGETLSETSALSLARSAFRSRSVDMTTYRLVESDQNRLDARIDHTFVWEDSLNKIGEGTFRIQAEVQGDEPVRLRSYFKPPEAWVRAEEETTTQDIVVSILNILFTGLFLALGLRVFIQWIRDRQVNWRFALAAAALYAVLHTLPVINTPDEILAGYPTSISLTLYLIMTGFTGLIISLLVFMAVGCILFGFMSTGYRDMEPQNTDLTTKLRQLLCYDTIVSRMAWRDAVILSYAACMIIPALSHLGDFAEQMLGMSRGLRAGSVPAPSAYFPVLNAWIGSVSFTMTASGIFVLIVHTLRYYFVPAHHKMIAIGAFILLLGGAGAEQPMEALINMVEWGAAAGAIWLAIRFLWRDNILAYVMTFFLLALTSDAWLMLTRTTAYQSSGLILVVVALMPLVAWGYLAYKSRRPDDVPSVN